MSRIPSVPLHMKRQTVFEETGLMAVASSSVSLYVPGKPKQPGSARLNTGYCTMASDINFTGHKWVGLVPSGCQESSAKSYIMRACA